MIFLYHTLFLFIYFQYLRIIENAQIYLFRTTDGPFPLLFEKK